MRTLDGHQGTSGSCAGIQKERDTVKDFLGFWLCEQSQSSKVIFRPARSVEHAGKSFDDKCVRKLVVGDRDSAPIAMFVSAVASLGSGEVETVGFERDDEFAR